MRTRIFLIMSLFCLLLGIAGCGGGGGDSRTVSSGPRKVVSAASLPATAGALHLTMNFPFGVEIAEGKLAADAVKLVGGPTSRISEVFYFPATTAAKGQLVIWTVTDATNGFAPGEYISIEMAITSDTSISLPVKSDFSITNVTIFDLNGAEVNFPNSEFTFETF